jgi:adenylylsulfate kinase
MVFWLTGLPCSGKTTLANTLAQHLSAEILDGDIIREITHNEDFSWEGRKRHIRSVAAMAHLLSKYTNVIVALVSPIREVREEIKQRYGFYEIFVKCPIDVCKKRDVKGMYAKALRGDIRGFTGIDSLYEEPISPDIIVETDKFSVDDCVKQILSVSSTISGGNTISYKQHETSH